MELIGVVPSLDQAVSDRVSCGLVGTLVIEVEPCPGQSVLDVVDDRALDGALVSALVGVHELPHLLLAAGRRTELRSVERVLALGGIADTLRFVQVEARIPALAQATFRLVGLLVEVGGIDLALLLLEHVLLLLSGLPGLLCKRVGLIVVGIGVNILVRGLHG